MKQYKCVGGFPKRTDRCINVATKPEGKHPIWCDECNNLRIAHIDKCFEFLLPIAKDYGAKIREALDAMEDHSRVESIIDELYCEEKGAYYNK